jgi:hypothetical protein
MRTTLAHRWRGVEEVACDMDEETKRIRMERKGGRGQGEKDSGWVGIMFQNMADVSYNQPSNNWSKYPMIPIFCLGAISFHAAKFTLTQNTPQLHPTTVKFIPPQSFHA